MLNCISLVPGACASVRGPLTSAGILLGSNSCAPAILQHHDCGFAKRAVTNHGLEALERQQFEQSRKFFALPEEVKREITMDENLRCAFSVQLTFNAAPAT